MFGIEHWVKQKVNNSSIDTLNITQRKKISFKKSIYRNLLYMTNAYIDPMVKLLKVERYFTSQVIIIFTKH